jgi:hypothetical protein
MPMGGAVGMSRGVPPLLEGAAQSVLANARSRLSPAPPVPPVLTEAERKDAQEAAKSACNLCGAIHAGPNAPACPRVRSFKLDPDGKITEATFWADGKWDVTRVLFVHDALDEARDEAADEADRPKDAA